MRLLPTLWYPQQPDVAFIKLGLVHNSSGIEKYIFIQKVFFFFVSDAPLAPPSDPAKAPVLRQPQLPPHGGKSDRGGVQPDANRRTHPHRTVQVHCVRSWPHGEDCCREARLQVQSHHCLNLSAPVPPDYTFTLHGQVRLSHTEHLYSCWSVSKSSLVIFFTLFQGISTGRDLKILDLSKSTFSQCYFFLLHEPQTQDVYS